MTVKLDIGKLKRKAKKVMTSVLSSQAFFTSKNDFLLLNACGNKEFNLKYSDYEKLSAKSCNGHYGIDYARVGLDSVCPVSLDFLTRQCRSEAVGKSDARGGCESVCPMFLDFQAIHCTNGAEFSVGESKNTTRCRDQTVKQYCKTGGTCIFTNREDQIKAEPIRENDIRTGTKRKWLCDDESALSTKRLSVLSNTLDEKKVERRKLLKISGEKLKDKEYLEGSLRRTVLVNNTLKRLQTEIREEKRSKRVSSCAKENFSKESDFSVLYNQCVPNCYLLDDPFFSGQHEDITDDMTDVLINSVLNCKSSEENCQTFSCDSETNFEDRETEDKF